MKTVLFLCVATVVTWIVLELVYARTKDADISARFIERSGYIPSRIPAEAILGKYTFKTWLDDQAKAGTRATYMVPVVFPLDYVFLFVLGLFLGTLSVFAAGQLVFLRSIPIWLWWLFPALYITSDFLEDSILVGLFSARLPFGDFVFGALRTLTKAKIATVSIAIGQAGFLSALWCLLHLYPAER
ncbi:hypothetical protein [Bradyrhizobium sp.]|uniref:hypothetical protein n=1 Tax=Bradyrhizobium sp. TaxID=376 RepID=UPI003C42DA68